MGDGWIKTADAVLTLFALGVATLLMPFRVLRFLRTANNNTLLYPTSIVRDLAVLLLIGTLVGVAVTLFTDWLFIPFDQWKAGNFFDLSNSFGDISTLFLWQWLGMLPFMLALDVVSERRMTRRLVQAAGGALSWDQRHPVQELHKAGETPTDNVFVLPGSVMFLADWGFKNWADGVPFGLAMHVLSSSLPVGLAFASMRLIGRRV